MSDRGLPIVDGAPACPFVAFEHDRDGRGLAPDHRHRCFAEPRPAPRALAHQEAYCLSSAFPVCPTFQDWARREAAATRQADGTADTGEAEADEVPESSPLPPRELEPHHAPDTDTPPPVPPRRNARRDWAAPPPWSASEDAPAVSAEPPAEVDRDAGLDSGSEGWGSASHGLAASAAYRLAGPDPGEPAPAQPATERPAPAQPATERPAPSGEELDAWPARAEERPSDAAGRRSRGRERGRATERPSPAARPSPGEPQVTPRDPASPADLFGPAWEPPRRYEAYPSLRTRVGLPGVGGPSRLGVAALAVVLAAIVLFFAGPMLLGIGSGPGDTGSVSPTPAIAASSSPSPTIPPAPTPQVYIVAKGDTISKIARRFKVTQKELLAANPQIKNPDKIQIGDQITIPLAAASSVPNASKVPDAGASTAP